MLQPVRFKQTHFGHIVGFSWISLLAGIILLGLTFSAGRQRPAAECSGQSAVHMALCGLPGILPLGKQDKTE